MFKRDSVYPVFTGRRNYSALLGSCYNCPAYDNYLMRFLSLSVVQFVRRAAASEGPLPQGQQRQATSNGHRTPGELEILKQIKDENDQIRER